MTQRIRRLDTTAQDFDDALKNVLHYEESLDSNIRDTVASIIRNVKQQGDAAVVDYTNRFDRLNATSMQDLTIDAIALQAAYQGLNDAQRTALDTAAQRVKSYHEKQQQPSWDYVEADGTRLGQKITALDRVGIYVPGGKAAYPSSVLMNAIPAKVAGVKEIIMVVPTPDHTRNPLVLAAAYVAGVDKVFTIGGAQAVAALAYGTESIPAVDKIVGPGNAYVAEAKRQVFGVVGIDMIAGPSEILIICDGHTNPDWIAMDLFSQAEHDEMAQSILLSQDAAFIDAVASSIERLLPTMPRAEIIRTSLANRGALIKVRDLNEACDIANTIAAEHLEISTQHPELLAEKIRHAGAMFLGKYSSEALGDYCAGPNHVLPTSGTARFSSPLGVYDFQKRTSIIHVSEQGAQTLGLIAGTLADGEGLPAHAQSARLRLQS